MTEGSIQQTITKESTKNGMSIIEVINVRKHWSTLTPVTKYVVIGYVSAAGLLYLTRIYNDGKESLMKFRKDKTTGGSKFKDDDEMSVTMKGCRSNSWSHFFDSIIFPYSIAAEIMPRIVLWLNK